MLRRNRFVLSLFLLSAGLLFPHAASAQQKKLDLSFIPEDALAAVVAHPRQVLTSPQATIWPTEVFSVAGKKEFGFDPLDLEQVIGVIGMPQPGGGPPSFGFVARFRQPIDAAAIGARVVKAGTDEELTGRKVRINLTPLEPSLAFIDDRTLVVANQQSLSWMLAAKQTGSPLQKLLQSVEKSPTIAGYAVLEPVRPLLAQVLPQLQRAVPPMFRDLTDLPMSIDNVRVSADLVGEAADRVGVELKFGTADAETAKRVAHVLKRGMNDGKSLGMALFTQQMERGPNDPEVAEAMLRYAQRMADMAQAMLEPKPEGNDVVIKAELRAGVAEVGMMSALLLPATQAARDAARRNQSQNNLKWIGLSLQNYHDKHNQFPSHATYDGNGKPLLSWRVYMLPELEEQALFEQFHLDEPWDSEHNKKLIDKMPAVFQHPGVALPGKTVYQAIVGKGAAFDEKGGVPLQSFTDGTSKTVMVVEVAPEKAVPWTKPADWEFDPEKEIDASDFGGVWAGGIFNAVFGDGHVEVLTRSDNPKELKARFTRNGGEIIP
jgi:prepilin-type processing-associated H-X9-DG protein